MMPTLAAGPLHPWLVPMQPDTLALVCAVEAAAHAHPWRLRHFEDSLAAGHWAQLLVAKPPIGMAPGPDAVRLPDGRCLLGYVVAMPGVDEVHLLNLTTAPQHQRQGWGRHLLQVLSEWACTQHAQTLWLEVRVSNQPALALYQNTGFESVGRRRAYYPTHTSVREDAVVMRLPLPQLASAPEVPCHP